MLISGYGRNACDFIQQVECAKLALHVPEPCPAALFQRMGTGNEHIANTFLNGYMGCSDLLLHPSLNKA
ncbi:hypothetical protein D3C78_1778210 [compost metagenome]